MPTAIKPDFSKPLDGDRTNFGYNVASNGVVVSLEADDPIFVAFRIIEIEGRESGWIVMQEMLPVDIEHAESTCKSLGDVDQFTLFNHAQQTCSFMPGEIIGQALFAFYVPLKGPQIKQVYIDEDYQSFGIATLAYETLMKHYGSVISDDHQTQYGARLWYTKLVRLGNVVAIDTRDGKIIEVLECGKRPQQKLWDRIELNDAEADDFDVPLDAEHSKAHIVLKLTPFPETSGDEA